MVAHGWTRLWPVSQSAIQSDNDTVAALCTLVKLSVESVPCGTLSKKLEWFYFFKKAGLVYTDIDIW